MRLSDDEIKLNRIAPEMLFDEQQANIRRARAPLHILIAEDDPVTQTLLQKLFSSKYSITVCSDPYQAVNDYLRVMPDLVFLDIDLGDRQFNGLDVLYTLRVIDADANIVILTGNDQPKNIAAAARSGALGFISKPFKSSRLMHYVQECELAKSRR